MGIKLKMAGVQLCTVNILFQLFNSLTILVFSVTLTHEVKNSFGLAGHLCILFDSFSASLSRVALISSVGRLLCPG